MEIADERKFLTEITVVCVAKKRDGSPHIALMTPGVDGAGRVIITSLGTTYKVRICSATSGIDARHGRAV
jgi:hypothetical protein